ncbi:hypothetical protein HZR84_07485 [Hyphobacterium sp. CCMP332]|nr:hypothetical protein HZR84_07485 [Hyphobacterium sp. CCMP332]
MNAKSILLVMMTSFFIFSCGDDSEDSPATPNPGTPADANKYSGSASYGDLVTFSIDQVNQSYVLDNETTGETESGNYDVMSLNGLEGVYKVSADGSNFFGVELDDKIVVGNFPSGNAQNDISFGVSSEIDNSTRLNEIAGDYIYIRLGNVNINGSTSYKEYGVFSLTADGNIHLIDLASGGDGSDSQVLSVEDLASAGLEWPIDESISNLDGTWSLNGSKSDRFDISLDGSNYTGYAYAAGTTTVFLMDLGTGNGFAIGFKVTEPGNTTGDYKYIDTWADGSKGAGNFTVSSEGNIDWTYTEDGAEIESGSFGPVEQVDLLPNVFYYYDYDGENDIYLVVAGDAYMHFIFNDLGELQSYGCGAQI